MNRRTVSLMMLSGLLALPTLALADGGEAVGTYLTSANTSSSIDGGNLNSPPQTWVKLNPMTMGITGSKTNTNSYSGGGSSGSSSIAITIANNGGVPLYLYVSTSMLSSPISMSTQTFGQVSVSQSVNYAAITPPPSNFNQTFNPNFTLYLYVSTSSSSYSVLTACQNPTSSSGPTVQTTGSGSQAGVVANTPTANITLTVSSSTCQVSYT